MEVAEFSVLQLFPTCCWNRPSPGKDSQSRLSQDMVGRARAYPAYLPYRKDVTASPLPSLDPFSTIVVNAYQYGSKVIFQQCNLAQSTRQDR